MSKKKKVKIDTTPLGSKFYRVNGLLHRENNLPAVEFNKSDFPINIGEIDVLNKLEGIHGTQVSGYRGGEYILDKDSPLFFTICASDSGDCVAITSHEIIDDTICFYLEPDCY